MLSIFTIPKPFRDHVGVIQRNALRSWSQLSPACEILLCGDAEGTREIAGELSARHVADLACNEYGTPLVDSAFRQVRRTARYRLLCYVNADILLLSDFLPAVNAIHRSDFLMIGRRWDLEVTEPLDFAAPDWEPQLRRVQSQRARLHPPAGSDFFVFPRDSGLGDLPPFAVGRPGWDTWMIYEARRLRLPVVDASAVTTVIHQNHDYRHVPQGRFDSYEGPEAEANRRWLPDPRYLFATCDATHVLSARGLRRAWDYPYLRKRVLSLPVLRPHHPLARLLRLVR